MHAVIIIIFWKKYDLLMDNTTDEPSIFPDKRLSETEQKLA